MDRRRKTPQDLLNMSGSLIAGGLIVVMAFVTYALVYEEVPEKNQNALLILIGILSTNITQVIQFFFGSSSQAKTQQDTIDTLAKTTQVAQALPAITDKAVAAAEEVAAESKAADTPKT